MYCRLLLMTFIGTSLASEPKSSCSQFEYMDNLLTKMIRQEFTFNQLKDDMLDLQTKVVDGLKQFKTMVDTNTNIMKKHTEDFQILEDSLQTKVNDGLNQIANSQNKAENEIIKAVDKLRDDIKEELSASKTAVRTDFQILTKELKSTTENDTNQVKTLVEEFQKLKEASVADKVAFLSEDVSDMSLSNNKTFVFKTTVINEGDGYDNGTGHFTAPIGGLYRFDFQLCLGGGTTQFIYSKIMANNKEIQNGFFRDYDTPKCYTANAVVRLQKGGEVWMACNRCSGNMWQSSDTWNTFSGHRLHA